MSTLESSHVPHSGDTSESTKAEPVTTFTQIPEINHSRITVNQQDFDIYLYPLYQQFLLLNEIRHELLVGELKKLLSTVEFMSKHHPQRQKGFRKMLVIEGFQFLCAFFVGKNKIRLCSPYASNELFLLKDYPTQVRFYPALKRLKDHLDEIVSLDVSTFPTLYDEVTANNMLPDMVYDNRFEQVEKRSDELAEQLVAHINDYSPSLFERMSDFGLGLTVNFAILRIHLLKFLAVLPSLDHDQKGSEVKRLFLESLRRIKEDSQKARQKNKKGELRALSTSFENFFVVMRGVAGLIPARLFAFLIRFSVKLVAKRFIAGENIEKGLKTLEQLRKTGRDATLDQLGELVVSAKEADHYCDHVIRLIKGSSVNSLKGSKNHAGINRAHISIKVSALSSEFYPHAEDFTFNQVAPRLRKILIEAKKEDVFINIDAEHYSYRDLVFNLYKRVLLETKQLEQYSQTGIVVQAYLRDSYQHLLAIVELAKERKLTMPVRLVKGAYWDAETIEARVHGHDAPQFLNKEETDLNFRQLIYKIFEFSPHIQLCIGSHNFNDHCFAEALRECMFKHVPIIEHQCLHMTYEALSEAMVQMGWPVRNYVPIGSLLVGMAYLVRRILENSSQVGVLTQMHSHKKLKKIEKSKDLFLKKIKQDEFERDLSLKYLSSKFKNVMPLRLYLKSERDTFEKSIERFTSKKLQSVYENKFQLNGELSLVHCSSDPLLVVGKILLATQEDVGRALTMLEHGLERGKWNKVSVYERSSVLIQAAEIMRLRRNDLAALIIYEAGKIRSEALADVDEAIDFLHFYARCAFNISNKDSALVSRGIFAVIAPWNFPLAIPCGMTCAALVAGNAVAFKSAGQTPLIAQEMINILHQAGVPQDILIHLPGSGQVVGNSLCDDSRVTGIVFTGSKEVGQLLNKKISPRVFEFNYGQNKTFLPAKVITEMGGKNAIIITANAELDEALSGVIYSAFGHAGQKCSAASRILVDNSIKESFLERFILACEDLSVGKSFDQHIFVNPLITKKDQERIRLQVKEAKKECEQFGGRVLVDRSGQDFGGFCVGPTVFELSALRSYNKNSYAQKELFGPVVHVIGFNDLDEAIKLFNSTQYALTGGIFSQSQDDVDYLLQYLKSGNLYVNRGCTGARVAIEPFGGFKMSGTGPKAGSSSYVRSFFAHPKEEHLEKHLKSEQGEDYQFDPCGPTQLTIGNRIIKISKGISYLLQNYELIFKGVYEDDKTHLRALRKWLQTELIGFISKKHPNLFTPGQLNYSNISLIKEKGMVLAYDEKPEISILIQIIMALSVGSGVTVACRNQNSFLIWNEICRCFRERGISKQNFDVYFASEKVVSQVLEMGNLEFMLIDGDVNKIKEGLEWVAQFADKGDHVKHTFTPLDAYPLNDFESLCTQFTYERAFAINTMRHGAALELEV